MIKEIRYRKCRTTNIVKNGHDYKGSQKYLCLDCHSYGSLDKTREPDLETRREALDSYFEKVSMRGVKHIFGVSRYHLARWLLNLFEKLPLLRTTLVK